MGKDARPLDLLSCLLQIIAGSSAGSHYHLGKKCLMSFPSSRAIPYQVPLRTWQNHGTRGLEYKVMDPFFSFIPFDSFLFCDSFHPSINRYQLDLSYYIDILLTQLIYWLVSLTLFRVLGSTTSLHGYASSSSTGVDLVCRASQASSSHSPCRTRF